VLFTNELNGRVEDFGEAFWRFVSQRSPLVGRRLEQNTPLVSIEYSDRYLNSPLPVRLLAEVIAHAPGRSSSSVVKLITTDQVSNFSSSSLTLLKHDWQVLKHAIMSCKEHCRGFGRTFHALKKRN
jgi:hypothetical protein